MPGQSVRVTQIGNSNHVSGAGDSQVNASDQASEDDDGAASLQGTVHMACVYQAGRLGCAYYDTNTGEMSVLDIFDQNEGPLKYRGLQLAKLQAQPAVIYVSTRAGDEFISELEESINADPEAGDMIVRLEASSLFSYKTALHFLQSLHVRGMPEGLGTAEKMSFLNSMINMRSPQQICVTGALLAILHREGLLGAACPGQLDAEGAEEAALPGASKAVAIESLTEASLCDFLTVDAVALKSLQIFAEESHPSKMGVGVSKEGLSVYGILNKCVTHMGRRLLRLWFMRPILNLQVLQDRQDTIGVLMRLPDVMKRMQAVLRSIKDVPKLIIRLQSTQSLLNPKDLGHLQDCISNLLLLQDLITSLEAEALSSGSSQQPGQSRVLESLAANQNRQESRQTHGDPSQTSLAIVRKAEVCIDKSLLSCQSLIASVIDMEQWEQEGMLVAYGISQELDNLKHTYHGLPDFLTRVVEQEMTSRIPRALASAVSLQQWSIVYMPQIGFVTRVQGPQLSADLQECLPDYTLAFQLEHGDAMGTYYHSDRTAELNQHFGDMLHKIHDLEANIRTELVKRVCGFSQVLHRASALAAELDCLVSLALAAREYNYVRPVLTTDNILQIQGGRHPLTELLVPQFVPNNTGMHEVEDRVQVVTGPNFSGKSCYAKQVGLIVFLAHIGSFVPAEAAIVGLTDRIFTRIGSLEACSVPESTFMMDLTQISKMLRLATSRSLCLIDEFGKGTLTSDGVGLLAATLDRFARGDSAPKTIACTHFSEILNPQYLPRHPALSFYTMDTIMRHPNQSRSAEEEVVFLYRIKPGYAAPSFGINCARLAGVNQAVLRRVAEVILLHADNKEVPAQKTEKIKERENTYLTMLQDVVQLNLADGQSLEGFLDHLCP